jgi:hypothetical protein
VGTALASVVAWKLLMAIYTEPTQCCSRFAQTSHRRLLRLFLLLHGLGEMDISVNDIKHSRDTKEFIDQGETLGAYPYITMMFILCLQSCSLTSD